MNRAVAYTRFSSDLQREESIEAQTRAIQKYCNDSGFVLLTVYADRGISGTSDKRPEFQRMIADSAKNQFDIVIVHKFDRFARNRYDSAFYKNILKKNNIKLISVLENLQDTPESVILESVIEGMNEYYSLNLSREVRKGMMENALDCKVTGGPPALGYNVDKNTQKYIVNEFEAEAVRIIFQMFLEDHPYRDIIVTLNNKGYTTRKGDSFVKNSLHAILRNERYTGVYIYVKDTSKNSKGKYSRFGKYDDEAVIRIPGGIPAIISESDFQRAQIKLKERQHKAAKYSAKQEYLLSGKILCGICGSSYAGNSRKPRADHPLYISYKCTRRNHRDQKCNNPEINRDKIEKIILQKLSKVLFNPKLIPQLIDQYNSYIAEKSGSAHEHLKVLKSEFNDVERKINNTVNLMVETGSSAFKNKLHELEQLKERLQFELSEAESAMARESFSEDQIRTLFHNAEQQLKYGTLINRRMIIDRFINKVVIYTDRIEVDINFTEDYIIKEVISQ